MTPTRRVGRHQLALHEHASDGSRDAPPVVLVHGTMDRATSLAKVARRLPALHVVRYDRRGYGDSRVDAGGEPWPLPTTIEDHVADLIDVLGGTPSVVVGHSMGGTIALAAAARHPELVLSVGAFESPRPWVEWWPVETPGAHAAEEAATDPPAVAERFMRRMIGDAQWERLPSRSRETRRAEGPALISDVTTIRARAYDDDAIRCPVLAGFGSQSNDHHARAAEELADLVPDGELFVVDGARHGAHLTHPDEVAAFVRRAVELAVASA